MTSILLRRRWSARILKGCASAAVLMALTASGDEFGGLAPQYPTSEFHFARLAYSDRSGFGGGWRGSWTVDYPQAEYHFTQGVERLTQIDIDQQARIITLDDDTIFDYPWLYAVEVGRWYLSDPEAVKLREYLLRGGFLMVDDFHGTSEWAGFMESLKRVFPDRPVIDIPEGDPVLHVLYDLDQRTQIPGIAPLMYGQTYEKDGVEPRWRGVYDDDGRLMVAINHNMDLGDAWEHADDPRYPEPMTTLAYRFAVNYAVYAMTH
ncbi:MAG: DUF4159 domain-containing protein [Gammaproteobacteria bacterium]|nr:DUF4159 domain-containing protein [Gammaproteobacteria bacterium]